MDQMRKLFRLLAFAALLGNTSAANATLVYNWNGDCQFGCEGTATATLLLNDSYTPGTNLTLTDLISWTYESDNFSLFIEQGEATHLTGVLPSSSGAGSFSIFLSDLQCSIMGNAWTAGWSAGSGGDKLLDGGGPHGWTRVSEPGTLLLIGAGLLSLALFQRIRRLQRAAFQSGPQGSDADGERPR